MKISVHPLFIVVLVLCLVARAWLFGAAILFSVVVHECSHAAVATVFGAKAREIRLLPFGAEVSVECNLLATSQKVLVLLAGAFGNLAVILVAGSLLWILPGWFGVLEVVIIANAVPAVLNLLPIYPLDGGKVLYTLAQELPNKRRRRMPAQVFSTISMLVFVGLFIACCFLFFNLPLLIMCIIMVVSIGFEQRRTRFVSKLGTHFGTRKHSTVEVAVTSDMTLLEVYKLVSVRRFTKFIISDRANAVFYENDLESFLVANPSAARLADVI